MLFEWRRQDIERKSDEANRRLHEIDSLRGDVGRLECANRELRTEVDGLRTELQAGEERLAALERMIADLMHNA